MRESLHCNLPVKCILFCGSGVQVVCSGRRSSFNAKGEVTSGANITVKAISPNVKINHSQVNKKAQQVAEIILIIIIFIFLQ